ncbi:MAG: class I SAM-dependent methyltransferase [Candidatus Woesearchaeota archaeon]
MKQVIEIGSGFTPHALNLEDIRYIEIDFPHIIKTKREIISSIDPHRDVIYIGGNIFSDEAWESIYTSILNQPTAVFFEGFMQYTNNNQRKFLFDKIRPIIQDGGFCFFEDSLTFNPHFSQIPTLRNLTERMKSISKKTQLTSYISQKELHSELKSYGLRVTRKKPFNRCKCTSYDSLGKLVLSHFRHWVLEVEK